MLPNRLPELPESASVAPFPFDPPLQGLPDIAALDLPIELLVPCALLCILVTDSTPPPPPATINGSFEEVATNDPPPLPADEYG